MLNELITSANANRPMINGRPSIFARASITSAIGKISCCSDNSVANSRGFGSHYRVTFELNGKRISRANLEKLLSA